MEEFGWGVKKDAKLTDCASSDVDRSVDELFELEVNSDQPAGTVAEECSTVSDHSGSDTDKSTQVKYNQLLPQHLSGLSLPSNDPAKWKQLTHTDKEVNGPPQILLSFPRDSFGRHFLENIFHETLPNGEKVSWDWLVWSQSAQGLFCFPCCLFQSREQHLHVSMLSKPDTGR